MVNVTTIILIFMMLEPQNCRPPVRETEYQPSEYQLSGIRTQRNPNSAEYEHSGIPTQRKCELSENANSVKMRTQRKCELSENANSAAVFFTPGGANFSRLGGRHGKPSTASGGKCPWTSPPPSSTTCLSASFSEKGSHLQN